MTTSFLHKQFLKHQRVFVRADLNVPINSNKKIENDARLKAIIPTIKHIQNNGGKIILATHIGRPSNPQLEPHLSTKSLLTWFEDQGFDIEFTSDLMVAHTKSYKNQNTILLLENLRFFAGEKQYSMPFAELLANLADVYVNDAFGCMHRRDASIALLPQLFLPQNRGWGLLVEKELSMLEPLHSSPPHPFYLVLGGAKVSDKAQLILSFLQHASPEKIIIGGKLAFPFLKLQGHDLGTANEPNDHDLDIAKKIITALNNTKLVLPSDFVTNQQDINILNTTPKKINELTPTDIIIDIGKESCSSFAHEIADAASIFMNGTMGLYEHKEGAAGTIAMIQAISSLPSDSLKIAGGGDAIAAVQNLGFAQAMTFLSTGGGATLAFLASENPWQELPGLHALSPS